MQMNCTRPTAKNSETDLGIITSQDNAENFVIHGRRVRIIHHHFFVVQYPPERNGCSLNNSQARRHNATRLATFITLKNIKFLCRAHLHSAIRSLGIMALGSTSASQTIVIIAPHRTHGFLAFLHPETNQVKIKTHGWV